MSVLKFILGSEDVQNAQERLCVTTRTLRNYALSVQEIIRALVESAVNYTESLSSGGLTWERSVRHADRAVIT